MMKKRRAYFAVVAIVVVGLCLFAGRAKNLNLRQPQIGAHVHPVTKRFLLQKNLVTAKQSAERMDQFARPLIEASAMSLPERWMKSIDLSGLQKQYAHEVKIHLQAMTEIMKMRREMGSLKKLREFDFQNLLTKSDYVLSLDVSARVLRSLPSEQVDSYKHERSHCAVDAVLIGRL